MVNKGTVNFGGFTAAGIGQQQSGMLAAGQSGWAKKTDSRPKKQLNYNEREISSQILRASKYRSAAEVYTRARSKFGLLKRCEATGQYKASEMRAALNHAQKMVRCAKMKMIHLKDEEREDTSRKRTEKRKPKRVKEAEVRELREKRQKHRLKERKKILEANLEYLKEKRENENKSDHTACATLDLSSAAVRLGQLLAEGKQLEQEITSATQTLNAADISGVSVTADGISVSLSAVQTKTPAGTADAGVQAGAVAVDTFV